HIEADVLLLDEVFAVGDEAFQRKCFGKIFEFKQRGGTIVFVSHDAAAVERLCDRAVLLRQGEVAFDGPTHEAIVQYRRLLAGADGGHIYHWLDDALTFVVYPSEGDRGMMRIDGRWTAEVTVTA